MFTQQCEAENQSDVNCDVAVSSFDAVCQVSFTVCSHPCSLQRLCSAAGRES